MIRRTASKLLPFLLLLLGAAAVQAQEGRDQWIRIRGEIRGKKWENAARDLAEVEKSGACKGASCIAAHALIADGTGDGAQAVEYARQATAAGQDSGLDAFQYNDLGALLYRRAEGRQELLKLAEATFRRADSIYTGGASNIRFNLAKVLEKLGHKDQAQEILKKLDADGLLIDPGTAILGDFQRPGRTDRPPNGR
jgi:tetratricopeptide (TPR) repeat protein